MIGSTKFDPRETWPLNFTPDPDSDGSGVYEYCPRCGDSDNHAYRKTYEELKAAYEKNE